ncbi:MAG: hypothetical protein MI892_04970, partial [Desulfobacterales bacterium]|nr:hypothetical protein [Desulfobacterales bacterium]
NITLSEAGNMITIAATGGPAGGTSANNTLYWNGSAWVESAVLTNDGTDITATGDLAVNGGDITTTAATVNLVNTNATTVNIACASTTTSIGAATGTTTIGNDLTVTGDATVTGTDLIIGEGTATSQAKIVMHDGEGVGTETTTIQAHSDVTTSYTLTLPALAGTADQILKTDGSGNLSWTDASGSGSALSVTVQSSNYTATLADDIIKMDTSGGTRTITLPTGAGEPVVGKKYYVIAVGTNIVDFVPGLITTGSNVINGNTSGIVMYIGSDEYIALQGF